MQAFCTMLSVTIAQIYILPEEKGFEPLSMYDPFNLCRHDGEATTRTQFNDVAAF